MSQQVPLQRFPAAQDPGLHGAQGNTQRIGDFGIAEAGDVAQDNGLPKPWVQTPQRVVEDVPLLPPLRLVERASPGMGRLLAIDTARIMADVFEDFPQPMA